MPVLEPARRGGPPEPEVYFRIVHGALDTAHGTTAYREQTVEIGLSWSASGPNSSASATRE